MVAPSNMQDWRPEVAMSVLPELPQAPYPPIPELAQMPTTPLVALVVGSTAVDGAPVSVTNWLATVPVLVALVICPVTVGP